MSKLNKILKRYYIAVEIELASPLALSSGFDENTDADVLRNRNKKKDTDTDGDGDVFIPGTSLAGAFRNYLDKKKDEPGTFGYARKMESNKDDGRMSSVFISDIYLNNTNITERDGVKLNYEKTVDNKFDYEIIETGATGILRMEQIVREKDVPSDKQYTLSDIDNMVLEEISILLSALDAGEIRLGSKKNRGCGWIKVKKASYNSFSAKQCMEWIEYCKNWPNKCNLGNEWIDWKKKLGKDSKYVSIEVPLRLAGGISIRKYSAQPQQADYEHITLEGKIPVIPGSSWNGAIRSCARHIMEELDIPDKNKKIEAWFGTDADNANKKTDMQQSMVVFKESIIKDAVELQVTRNKVNRFDASTVDGALYTETSYFGGTTTLKILIQKRDKEGVDTFGFKPLIGLLMLIIQELENGYLAVGGQTAVGKGIFESNGAVRFSDGFESNEARTQCLRELADLKEAKA